MIYLNNAATTLQKPPCVIQAVVEAMIGQGSCGRGSHASELTAARTVFHTREALARFFAFPHPERVVFTANATQALNTALWGLLKPGDHVIATDWDHNSVLRPLHALAQTTGVKVDCLPADRQGRLEYDQLDGLLRPNTRLLVGTHASNLTGNLLDVERMAAFAKKHGLVFLLDAAQTALAVEQDNYAVSQLKYEQGNLSENDLLEAQDKVSEAQETVDGAANDLFSAYNNYRWAVEYGILN